jgi:hypothetical protein
MKTEVLISKTVTAALERDGGYAKTNYVARVPRQLCQITFDGVKSNQPSQATQSRLELERRLYQ